MKRPQTKDDDNHAGRDPMKLSPYMPVAVVYGVNNRNKKDIRSHEPHLVLCMILIKEQS